MSPAPTTNIQTQLTPVIAMSTSNDAELPAKVEGLGAHGFLTKPIEVGRLREMLNELAGRSGPASGSAG